MNRTMTIAWSGPSRAAGAWPSPPGRWCETTRADTTVGASTAGNPADGTGDPIRGTSSPRVNEMYGSEFCFVTKANTHIGRSNLVRQVFHPILKVAKLPRVKFHALRHSHASALLQEGASIKAVSQRLGHSTVELTLRVYFHLLLDADDSLAEITNKLMS